MLETQIRVIIVDSSPVYCDGLEQCLKIPKYLVLAKVHDLTQVLPLVENLAPKLILLGVTLLEEEKLSITRVLHTHFPMLGILLITENSEDPLFQEDAISAGASSLLRPSSSCEECRAAIEEILSEHSVLTRDILSDGTQPIHLTTREIQFLQNWKAKKTDREIAKVLGLAHSTVRTHARNILQKLQVTSRKEAVRRADRRGLLKDLSKTDLNS